MSLERTSLPIDSLIPIQSAGVSRQRLAAITRHTRKPIHTVRYEGGKSLLVDGHHRAYNAFMEGRTVIDAFCATDDEDVTRLGSIALTGCSSISDVHYRFNELWLPLLEEAGIDSVSTLPVSNAPRLHL